MPRDWCRPLLDLASVGLGGFLVSGGENSEMEAGFMASDGSSLNGDEELYGQRNEVRIFPGDGRGDLGFWPTSTPLQSSVSVLTYSSSYIR